MNKIILVIAKLSINDQMGNELAKREYCLNILLKNIRLVAVENLFFLMFMNL